MNTNIDEFRVFCVLSESMSQEPPMAAPIADGQWLIVYGWIAPPPHTRSGRQPPVYSAYNASALRSLEIYEVAIAPRSGKTTAEPQAAVWCINDRCLIFINESFGECRLLRGGFFSVFSVFCGLIKFRVHSCPFVVQI